MFHWKVYGLLTAFICASAFAGIPDPQTYEPDFRTSDIYLPHLKRTPLSGWWKVKKVSSDRKNNPADEGTAKRFYAADYDDSAWMRDIVPNDIHVPFLMKIPKVTDWGGMWNALPQTVREWGGVAWFRRTFSAPEVGAGERAILTFEEVLGDFTVYVNGVKIGSGSPFVPVTNYRGPGAPQSFDVTDALRPGQKNTIAVRLFHNGHPVRWGWAGKAGLTDLVYLDVRPKAYTANILVTTLPNRKDVLFECILSGSAAPADTDRWTGEIFEWNSGRKAGTVAFGKRSMKDGLALVSGTAHLENPKLWSCESPFLYGIRVRNARGELAGVQRFGVRTFGVENGNFVLNGKPVALRGLTLDGLPLPVFRHGYFHVFRFNPNDFNRKYWKTLCGEGNVNHVRTHSATFSRGYYDIFDELGILIADELQYPETMISNPVRADMISVKGFDGACDKQGNLLPEFVAKVKSRIRNSYSHPSVCMYSFGNEIRQYDDLRVEALLNNLYDLYHQVDTQKRPTTNSSGRFWKDGSNVKEMHEREKLDYIDTHDYTGSINNFPLAYCDPVAGYFIETVRKYYGAKMPPIINGEVVYMANHYFGNIFDGIWKSPDDPQPDWDKLLDMLTQWRKDRPDQSFLSLYWVRNWGAKNYKFRRALGRGIYTERILEAYRKHWPEYDGYENLCDPYLELGNAWPFDRISIQKNEAFPFFARVNSPVIAILDYIAPNRFADEEFSSRVHAINNSESDYSNVRFEAEIVRDGKTVRKVEFPLGNLVSNEKKIRPLKMKSPKESGEYRLVYRLRSGNKLLCERDREIVVRPRPAVFQPLKTGKKIALYDASSVFGGLKPYSTAGMLKRFGIPVKNIRSFENLGQFDLLIIGAESLDSRIANGSEQIRSFVENGGRLLIFEQNVIGRIPFLPELEYVLAGPGQFSEILQFDHPALKNLDQKAFFCWNQKDWSVYRVFISPISKAAIMTGGDTTQWGSDHFGMTAAHLKLGKGDVLMCQAEVTKTLNDDSGAALFARRLLETLLDDSTRAKAREFKGLPMLKSRPLAEKNALFISLREAANMGFADPVARDGKGGWTDQGPRNDLAPFPVGKRLFGVVPFEILSPASNGGRSCVVQSKNPTLKFKPESRPIAVGAKVKRLLFLHSGGWIEEKAKERIGEYVVTYESGRKVRIPLVAGENIGDWWNTNAPKTHADCVWSSMNGSGVVGVYLFEWKNPHPNDTIRNLVLKIDKNAAVGLVGLTGEKL